MFECVGDVVSEAVVAALRFAHWLAVDGNCAVPIDGAEVEQDTLAFPTPDNGDS